MSTTIRRFPTVLLAVIGGIGGVYAPGATAAPEVKVESAAAPMVAAPAATSQSGQNVAAERVPPLVFVGVDKARTTYDDSCSNGKNSDDANRNAFITRMLASSRSKLGKAVAKVKASTQPGNAARERWVSEWVKTYFARPDGCGVTDSRYSAYLGIAEREGARELRVVYLATIDDVVDGAERVLSVRSVVPITIRRSR